MAGALLGSSTERKEREGVIRMKTAMRLLSRVICMILMTSHHMSVLLEEFHAYDAEGEREKHPSSHSRVQVQVFH